MVNGNCSSCKWAYHFIKSPDHVMENRCVKRGDHVFKWTLQVKNCQGFLDLGGEWPEYLELLGKSLEYRPDQLYPEDLFGW